MLMSSRLVHGVSYTALRFTPAIPFSGQTANHLPFTRMYQKCSIR